MTRKKKTVTFVNLNQRNFGTAHHRAIINNHILQYTKAEKEENTIRFINSLSWELDASCCPKSARADGDIRHVAATSPSSLRGRRQPAHRRRASHDLAADARELVEDTLRNLYIDSAHYPTSPSQVSSYLDTSLDPFFQLPVQTSKAERFAVQIYFTQTPTMLYGMRPNPSYCSLRDYSIPLFQLLPMSANWMVIGALQQAALLRGLPVPDWVLRRKAKAYMTLNKALMEPKKITHEAFAAVCYASLFEGRNTGREVGETHVKGIEAILKQAGGLYAYAFSARGVLAVSCAVGVVSNKRQSLDSQVSPPLASMAEHIEYLDRYIGKAKTEVLQDPDHVSMRMQAALKFVSSLSELMSNEVTGPLLQVPLHVLSGAGIRTRFVLLYGLNLLIQDFGDGFDLGSDLLRRVLRHAANSTAFDEEGRPVLRAIGLLWLIGTAATETYGESAPSRPGDKVVWWCAECRDGLKVFSSLSETKQLNLLKLLRGWLDTLVSSQRQGTDHGA